MEGIDLHWLQDDRMTHFRTNKTLLCLTQYWCGKDDGLNQLADDNNSILWSEVWNLLHTVHNELSDARCHITENRMLHWFIALSGSAQSRMPLAGYCIHGQPCLSRNRISRWSIQSPFSLFSIVFYPQSKVLNFRSQSYFISPKEFDLDKVDTDGI